MQPFCYSCKGDEYEHDTCQNTSCASYGEPVPCDHVCKAGKSDADMASGYLDEFWR